MPSDGPNREYTLRYPRRIVARGIVKGLGRLVLPIAFRIQVSGRENFPRRGPLLVVGNHTAAMEAVLMAVYTPWQVEFLGTGDIPQELVTEMAGRFLGYIHIRRGRMERGPMTQALGVLKQGGVLGVFPEGGIWEPGARRPHAGVAWLSYRTGAPVLPIAFGGTPGALGAALRLERPRMTMHVGQVMPAASLPQGKARKVYLEGFAEQVMDAVYALLPPDDPARQVQFLDERFELELVVHEADGAPLDFPASLNIRHRHALVKFLHRPAILKIFRKNLDLPVEALQDLAHERDAGRIADATQAVLDYLENENPFLLTYRFGPKEGEATQKGLQELRALARWAVTSNASLTVTPIRRYRKSDGGEEIVQVEQGTFEGWM